MATHQTLPISKAYREKKLIRAVVRVILQFRIDKELAVARQRIL
jgi:hypothetical protein